MEEGLQNLYCLLRKLQEQGRYREGNIQSVHSAFAKKESGHLIEFSNVLFEELVRQSENLHALLRGILGGVSASDSTAQFTKEGFIWLLRCCLMMLQFLDFDMSFLWEKCGVLFKTLGRIFSQKLVLNSHGCRVVPARNSFLQCRSGFLGGMEEEANQMFNFFSLIFEVFISEFSENVGLNKHLNSVNVLTTNSEKLCDCHKTHADNCIVLRFVFSHFLQLVRNDQDFGRFLHSLSGSSDMDKMIPEISLDVSLKLISTPFIFSAPLIIQAHLILLASRCISAHLPIEGGKSDTPLTSCFINPFELSANLYLSYLSTLQLDGVILGTNGRSNLGDSSGHKMNLDRHTHEAYLVDFSHLYSEDILSGTKSQVIAYSASYIRGDHPLIDRLCQEATYLVVDHIIKSIIPMEAWEQRWNENDERIRQEVYCLTAAMKLMNSSLLHIIWILRHTGSHNEMVALRESLLSKAFQCLCQSVSIIRIGGCRTDQKVQKILYNMFGAYGGMHQEIKFMLVHISSFLVFSFKRKFDFLWKGCISMMMTLMNLLLLEEGNLGLSKIFELLKNSQSFDFEGLTYRNTSVIIARNLEKTRMLYLKTEIKYVHVEENRTVAGKRNVKAQKSRICSVAHESQANTCNGERFINCVPSYHRNPSEWNDLVDFIECRPERDYCSWLKNRNKFNKWKQGKSAIFKSRKKKRKTNIKKSFYNLTST